jgi:hypothetical protein
MQTSVRTLRACAWGARREESSDGSRGRPRVGRDVDEVAWKTAVDAAPGCSGSQEVEEEDAREELFEKLEPFKPLVSEDIREGEQDDDAGSLSASESRFTPRASVYMEESSTSMPARTSLPTGFHLHSHM